MQEEYVLTQVELCKKLRPIKQQFEKLKQERWASIRLGLQKKENEDAEV